MARSTDSSQRLLGTILSTSILLSSVAFINYLIDSYAMYVASAVAANTLFRSACAPNEPLFMQYVFGELELGGWGV
jgi:MFS transporter, DHA1 family, multidrug resistance protein